ncbi:MAG: c-type cytochrome biogenesis protein CcmI [Rhizobiales bacterium]|nr:c-type cytochrome biogenesis protein CcmI [Hyphomicrobiales bacterium]
MTLWFILALMTVAAVFAVLWPLSRHGAYRPSGTDIAVYQDQLEELDRDRKAGLIAEPEAVAARVEVARRLIAAADADASAGAFKPSQSRRRVAMVLVLALALLPIGAGALYVMTGSPQLPGMPLAARVSAPAEASSIESLIAKVEAHLERSPEDGRGWEVLAPVYMRLGRFDDAVKARRNALRLHGATAAREADFGEALVGAANGVVTADAKAAFERARALDARMFKAAYFLGLAAEQDGRREEAASIWRGLIATAPPEASWVELIRSSLARVDPAAVAPSAPSAQGSAAPGSPSPGPTADDMAAAASLPPEQRSEMVRGMVDRLATRLRQDGSDVDGWLRLLRAYAVLGDAEKAKAAAAEARRALSGAPEKLHRVEEAVKALGLEG